MNLKLKKENGKWKTHVDFGRLYYNFLCLLTAMIGHTMHHSLFWSIIDFILFPLIWAKWLIWHQVNLTIIHKTFESFLQ